MIALRYARSGLVADDHGATALEFAMILPVLLTLLFGIMDGARAVNAWMVFTQASRVAARDAAGYFACAYTNTCGDPSLSASAWTNSGGIWSIDYNQLESDVQTDATTYISNLNVMGISMGSVSVSEIYCSGLDASGSVVAAADCATVGPSLAQLQSVQVQVTAQVNTLTPLIQALAPSIPVTATTTVRAG